MDQSQAFDLAPATNERTRGRGGRTRFSACEAIEALEPRQFLSASGSAPSALPLAATPAASSSAAQSPIAATGKDLNSVEGVNFQTEVATFTDPQSTGAASDYAAIIDWGDGFTSPGFITAADGGGFSVTGGHGYRQNGTRTVTVTITAPASGRSATATSTMSTIDVQIGNIGPQLTTDATTGVEWGGIIASFTDPNRFDNPNHFTATIQWGDGSQSAGAVVQLGPGRYDVVGRHTFDQPGTLVAFITLRDDGGKRSVNSATFNIQAAVGGATALQAAFAPISAAEGATFSGKVAHVFAGGASSAGELSATITWEDGTTDAGRVIANDGGGFDVLATHTWTTGGEKAVAVTISKTGGQTTTVNGIATVGLAALHASGRNVGGGAVSVPVAGVFAAFTDDNAKSAAADFAATIDWGDGTTSTGVITKVGKTYQVSGTHGYGTAATFNAHVTITDVDGGTAAANAKVTVKPASGTVGSGHHHVGGGNGGSHHGGAWTKLDQIFHHGN